MKKRTYIQPEVEAMILPKDALMGPITIPGSSEGPEDPISSAPKKKWLF